ncbi:MAG: DUF1559 domain-containing protein [Planctomycetes bacterium]|nr:DUF1559 domain-containing protein [Planctomycetota bacterium]
MNRLPRGFRSKDRLCGGDSRGFTLVELLVVIAIIGLLVALLLPAVQSAREAARRMHCTNNIKQIALALHTYESSHGALPAAGRGANQGYNTPLNGEIKGTNGLVALLPYLEQKPIYDRFNRDQACSQYTGYTPIPNAALVGDPALNGNAALSETEISVFLCPSDPYARRNAERSLEGWHYGPAPGIRSAKTNYDFVTDSYWMFLNYTWKEVQRGNRPSERMFGWESECKFADVLDGSSNTFMLGETTGYHVNGAAFAWAYRGHVMCGVDPVFADSPSYGGINVWHQPWIHPSWQSPPFTPFPGRARSWWCPAASLHPNGTHFAMGDASVHFVHQNVEFAALGYLTRMMDGQTSEIP